MVDGLAQMQARWAAIPARVREEVAKSMEKVAEEVVRDMRRIAPYEEGDLVRSINWTFGEAPAGTITIGRASGGAASGGLVVTIYAGGGRGFHARFQEFGTVNMAANPFFFPIWRIWRRRAKARIAAAVRRGLKAGRTV